MLGYAEAAKVKNYKFIHHSDRVINQKRSDKLIDNYSKSKFYLVNHLIIESAVNFSCRT
jgi:hypothetical protein